MPPQWGALAQALGGVARLSQALGWSYLALYRRARGATPLSPEQRAQVATLARLHGVPSPTSPHDLSALQALGDALTRGYPTSPHELRHLRTLYDTPSLIDLAENDQTSPQILRAVTLLLES